MSLNNSLKNLMLFLCILAGISSSAQSVSDLIKVNQIGYLPMENKSAYVSSESAMTIASWSIRNADDDNTLYEGGMVTTGIEDEATGEFVYELEFSDFNTKGHYYIDVAGLGRSFEFEISDSVYNDVFKVIMKGFYYQRSGVELTNEYAGKWSKPAEYADDAYIYAGFDGTNVIKGDKIDAAGGWRDAGDPNKKVVPASIATYQLLTLYEYFPTYIKEQTSNIPGDSDFTDLSDFLTETKVSLDWLLKMQRSDGAVWHAVGQANFYLDNLGHLDPYTRFLMPVSTTATADFAAVMATAYRVFKAIDSDYANKCLESAEAAWLALNTESIWNNPTMNGEEGNLQYPEANGYSSDPPGINNTAVYEDTDDSDERHWAAGELAIATGKSEYHDYFKSGIEAGIWYPSLWPAVGNLANFSYAMAFKDENNATVNTLKGYISSYMDVYLGRIETTGFGICLAPADYFWGSNSLAGQFAYTFLLSYSIIGDERYKDASLGMLNYILGTNSLNQTFISGIGDKPVENIFHLPSLLDGVDEVVPGLIPGGPNQYLVPSDLIQANLINTQNPPPAKCYVDSEYSFSTNEAVILESSVWAFVTGYFYYRSIDEDNDGYVIEDDCDDANGLINPGQTETPYNGIDDDCDPLTLDDDLDNDGYLLADDCDDNNSAVNPGSSEIPYNTIDDDCDASTLDDDLDQDGFVLDEDCNDNDSSINPSAEDIPNNGVDENCDGEDLVSSLDETYIAKLKVAPNPASSILFVNGGLTSFAYRIIDLGGRTLTMGTYKSQGIDISSFENGLYFLQIEDKEDHHILKFAKN